MVVGTSQTEQALRFMDVMKASAPSVLGETFDSLVRDRNSEDVGSLKLVTERLVELGVPRGLAVQLASDDQRIGKRIYLLDNSGSMNAGDGHILQQSRRDCFVLQPSTRWEETCALAREHAAWNVAANVPCEFMLLNTGRAVGMSPREDIDYVCINQREPIGLSKLESFLQRHPPRGVTPISDRLREIRERIESEADKLVSNGQMVFLTIVTDGLPTCATSGESKPSDRDEMVRQLKRLALELPVQMVIRLCTDEDDVVKFYDNIDAEEELPLDVLDDIKGEAEQIAECGNDWFVYSPMLHRLREAGTLCKILDDIDEKRLAWPVMKRLAGMLLPDGDVSTPLVACDDQEFVEEARRIALSTPPVYNPVTQKMECVLNVNRLKRYRPRHGLSCLAWCS